MINDAISNVDTQVIHRKLRSTSIGKQKLKNSGRSLMMKKKIGDGFLKSAFRNSRPSINRTITFKPESDYLSTYRIEDDQNHSFQIKGSSLISRPIVKFKPCVKTVSPLTDIKKISVAEKPPWR